MHTAFLKQGKTLDHRFDMGLLGVSWKQLGLFSQKQRVPNLNAYQKTARECVKQTNRQTKKETQASRISISRVGNRACIL